MNSEHWAFDLLSGPVGLATLRDEWQALADRLPHLHFAQCPQWAEAYMTCLADRPASLCWVTVRRSGELVAVWPLEHVTRGWGALGVRELRTLSHAHMTLSDIVADPGDAALWPALWVWLERTPGVPWDRMVLPQLADDSVLARWLGQGQSALRQSREIDGSAWLDCDRPYEVLLKAASANHRSSLSRGAKRAAELGVLRYETFTDPAGMAGAMTHFLAIEASGWKGEQGGAVACKAELVDFYTRLTAGLGARGQCEIDLLWLGEKPIATIFWFRTGGQLHLQKIAYLEELANLGPGKLIMAEALKRACGDAALQRVSFITRCPWADGWRTSVTPVWRHQMYPDTVRGRLIAALDRHASDAKARLKPLVQRWRAGPPARAAT